jgi:S1-C subfamily serine protease
MFTCSRIGIAARLSSAATVIALSAAPAIAAKVSLTVVSEPSGANIEWNGRFMGTTPYTTEVEDYVVKAPRFLWSNFLNAPIVLRVWKEGYLPKVVEMTSGPFLWVNQAGTAKKIYYIVESPEVHVLLERDPSAVPNTSRNAAASVPPPPPTVAASIGTGTGFIISGQGYIATNYHVVKDATQIVVRLPGRAAEVSATIVVKDSSNDLAILKADGLPTPPTAIVFAEPSLVKVGQDTFTLGFPLGALMGSTVRLSTGTINSLFGMDDDPRVYQISNPVQPGNSGGPLFNKDGQLIGIVVAQLDAKILYEAVGIIPQNVNFAVKASLLKNLVDTLTVGSQITNQTNNLAGLARDTQAEALTPTVVEITSHRGQPKVTQTDSQATGSTTNGLPSQQTGNIEGFTPDQVRQALGPPSLTSNSGPWPTWYYDSPQGTLDVYFVLGKATLQRPSTSSRSSPAPNIEGFTPDQVRQTLGLPSLTNNSGRWVTWYYDTPDGTLKVFFVQGRATRSQP